MGVRKKIKELDDAEERELEGKERKKFIMNRRREAQDEEFVQLEGHPVTKKHRKDDPYYTGVWAAEVPLRADMGKNDHCGLTFF